MMDGDVRRFGDPVRMVSAIEQVPYMVLVCEGPDLIVVGLNAAVRAMIPGREALGRSLHAVFADLAAQQWLDLCDQVYRTGEPVAGREWRTHLTLPDGSVREVYATYTITPWRRADGQVRGIIGAGSDVSATVRARLDAARRTAAATGPYRETTDVITAVQTALLPGGLPVLPQVRIAASYLGAPEGTRAGGDWYDAVPRPDGSVALVLGDVVGHGVTASATMGQLRAVLQERLAGGAGPAAALDAADRLTGRVPAAYAATVCVVVLDVRDGSLAYCTAGHPPPLVLPAAGEPRYLPVTGAAPLGTGRDFPTGTARLDPGDLLLLYSDGVLERPGRTTASATVELVQTAAATAAGRALRDPGLTPADRVCTQTVELLVRTTGHDDDIALLCAQRIEPTPDLALRLPAGLSALSAGRAALGRWLDRVGAEPADVTALQHALGELVINAIEHAFAVPGRGEIVLYARHTGTGEVHAAVRDDGRWREPAPDSPRGRGLAMTAKLVTGLRLAHTGGGTTATVRHRLSRPARLLSADGTFAGGPVAAGRRPDLLLVLDQPGTAGQRVRVDGPLDAGTAATLRDELLRRTRGGTVPLTVDLTGVTHLASAGVAVLYQTGAQATLTLYAPPGSPAQQILALVALPHTEADPDR